MKAEIDEETQDELAGQIYPAFNGIYHKTAIDLISDRDEVFGLYAACNFMVGELEKLFEAYEI